ncbi:serine/threonine protein kinase [Nocardioides humilatus]|uniref:non-specific serine/threonine protein kinase n=1 Tax=Nocardioides humilatus TaxID=2607660 RepID=A0A5B1LP41_9ACTN|nr:serine/threonine-protein kinase [Nocardioides humilatus]KAA1421540.1 serine/threonine protein kinase [Nocardioides humilatus]
MLPGVGSDFGRYRITGRLGRGGMGVVFSAVHRDLDRPVALKLLTPDLSGDDSYRHRFLREARILARLDSPHIVRVYDTGEQDGWLFIATQLINGGDLKQVLDTTGPLPIDAGIELVVQIAEGLAEAHEAGILHRDIKPSNVLLRQRSDGRRQAILCDLGIATVAGSESTLTVGVIGTPTYMSPERHQGEDATAASDIYALGCLLWATITGGPPYQGTPAEIFRGHVHGAVPQLELDQPHAATLNQVLATTMAKDPAARYESVAAVLTALRGIDPFAFGGSYRDDTTDTMRPPPVAAAPPVADGTIVVPYVESLGVPPSAPPVPPMDGFVGAGAVPLAEPSLEAPVPVFEPSVEMQPMSPPPPPPPAFPPPPPVAEPSVEVPLPPPPPVAEPSVEVPVEPSVEVPPVEAEEPAADTAPAGWAAAEAAPPAPPVALPTVAVPGSNPELTNARPPGTPLPPPPPGAFTPPPDPPKKRRRGALVVGFVALAVAAVLAAVLVVVAPWSGGGKGADEANADTPTGSGSVSESASESVTDPTTAPPDLPPKPDAPKVSVKAGYRSVAFKFAKVKSRDYDVAYQRVEGAEWIDSGREFSLPTVEGGDKGCTSVRVAFTNDAGTTASDAVRECGKSEPKALRVFRSTSPCDAEDEVAGHICRVYNVEITGFAPGSTEYMVILQPCAYNCRKPLEVGKDGRSLLDHAAIAYDGNTVEIQVGKLTQSVFVGG